MRNETDGSWTFWVEIMVPLKYGRDCGLDHMVCASKQAGQGAWVIGPIRERVLEIGAIREKKHWLRNMKEDGDYGGS